MAAEQYWTTICTINHARGVRAAMAIVVAVAPPPSTTGAGWCGR